MAVADMYEIYGVSLVTEREGEALSGIYRFGIDLLVTNSARQSDYQIDRRRMPTVIMLVYR